MWRRLWQFTGSRAGIKANDIIISVNGEQVFNVGDYEKIIGANYGIEVRIVLKHPDASTTEVKVTPEANARRVKAQPGLPCLR